MLRGGIAMIAELYLGDCLDVMKTLPEKSIDLILCDLPYGKTQNKKDKKIPFEPLWEQYKRLIKDRGCIVLFAQGSFYIELVCSNKAMFKYDLVWDKVLTSGFLNAKRMPLRQHEQIAVFYKKAPTYNPQFTQGKPLHSKGKAYLEKDMTNRNYGKFNALEDTRKGSTEKYPTSIIKFSKPHPSITKHATQKSVELCEWLVKTYSNPYDTVLDNCMGSGTIGIACKRTSRNYIGIDNDPEAYETAKSLILEAKDE